MEIAVSFSSQPLHFLHLFRSLFIIQFSSSPEERSMVDSFNSSLASLFTSVNKLDAESSKSAFVSSATALEKWIALAGLSGQLKGF